MDETINSEQNETHPSNAVPPVPVFWIPFGIASILLVIVGLFRFSQPGDNIYFIYVCLIAFAIASLPWISAFRVKGLFEIERAIEHTKEDVRDRIEQTGKRFDDRLMNLRTELISSLNSIQSQVSQQASFLNSTQSQFSQQATMQAARQSSSQIIAIGDAIKQIDELKLIAEKQPKPEESSLSKAEQENLSQADNSLPVGISQEEYSELKGGFAKAATVALNDPLGVRCGYLIRQLTSAGLPMSRLNEIRLYKNITDEQFQTLINLKLIMIVAPKRQGDEETVLATNLGRIYADYWKIDLISGLPDLKKNFEDWAGKLGQLMTNPIISSMVPVILSVAKMATSPIGTSESTVESSE